MWVWRLPVSDTVRHPAAIADSEINAFLAHLAVKENVSPQVDVASTPSRPPTAVRVSRSTGGQIGAPARRQARHPAYGSCLVVA